MSLTILLHPKCPIKRSSLSLIFRLFPNISSFHFSSVCRGLSFPPLSQTPPPIPKKIPFEVSIHGKTWKDPYHWMSNTEDPDLSQYLKQENSYAEAFMADTQNLQRTLFTEMTSRMTTKISTPPERLGPWLYYQYIPEGKEYPVLCRRLEPKKSNWITTALSYVRGGFGREQILLDWNQIAEHYGYVHVGTCRISPDHNFLAYTLDCTGSEQFMLQIKDLRSGSIIPKVKVSDVVSLAWAQDGNTLFYTQTDENQRPCRVLCSNMDSDSMDGVTVFTECDSSFCVDITSTKDGKFITVNSNSRTSSEAYIIDASNPLNRLQKIRERTSHVQYFLEHHYGFFYILTNAPLSEKEWSGEGYYLSRCRVKDIKSARWENIIFPSEDITLEDMDIFDRHLVLFLNMKGNPMLCSISLPISIKPENRIQIEDHKPWFFPLPPSSCSIAPGLNHDFMNSVYRVVLSSPVMPDAIVDYDMSNQRYSIVQQEEVRGLSCGLNVNCNLELKPDSEENVQNSEPKGWKDFSNAYCCETQEATSLDGAKVPLTILYSRTAWKKGLSPCILQGYGAYGETLDRSWCPNRLSLLDRGWVVAFADVRGGGGDTSWHKSGSGLHKKRSFSDFISCANHLIKENYVHRDQLAGIGFSAGGLLLGAAINMFPGLFRAAVLKVPFLDVCNTLLDPNLPLTILDYEEFGNPQIKSQFECISSYSPYDNISHGSCYPSMLVTASLHDSRVGVWEAAKWVAKVRDITCSGCSDSVILKTNMSGGHFGEGGRFSQCEETAYEYAFLLKAVGNLNHE